MMTDCMLRDASAPGEIADHCPACRGRRWTDFFVARGIPADVGSALTSEREALAAPLADITLAFCHRCEVVWNRSFDNSRIAFQPGYDAGLHHSPLVQAFVDGVIDRLIRRFDLRGKQIVEIGCGSGYFLRRICERGPNSGTGIDPTVSQAGAVQVGAGRVNFIRDFYSARHGQLPCDFVCCQSVLEDIPNVAEFLTAMRPLARQRPLAAYFEVFNGGRAFEQQEIWSIHYEQCNYFGLNSFRRLFQRCGFRVLDAGTCPGNDQYIFVEAKIGNDTAQSEEQAEMETEELPRTLSNFADRHASQVDKWQKALADCCRRGQRVVLWGSGGKGVSFLNSVGRDSGIRYVVDINPARHGRFVPRSAQQIVPPGFLADYRPDVIILSNPAYDMEIRRQIAEIGIQPEIRHA